MLALHPDWAYEYVRDQQAKNEWRSLAPGRPAWRQSSQLARHALHSHPPLEKTLAAEHCWPRQPLPETFWLAELPDRAGVFPCPRYVEDRIYQYGERKATSTSNLYDI